MLIVEAKSFNPLWRDWSRSPCQCGYKGCTKWDLDFSGAEGKLEADEARLVVAAPKILQALVGIVGLERTWENLNEYQQTQARGALKDALGSSKVLDAKSII